MLHPCACRVHFVLIVLYNLYAMGVLWWHYSAFLVVRQHYLVRGESTRSHHIRAPVSV